jgi:hypothetical protein
MKGLVCFFLNCEPVMALRKWLNRYAWYFDRRTFVLFRIYFNSSFSYYTTNPVFIVGSLQLFAWAGFELQYS